MVVKAKAKKKDVKVVSGVVHVHTTSNNTLINIVDMEWNKIVGGWTGMVWYKGSKKSTPYAAQLAAETATKAALIHGLKTVDVFVKGPGSGREAAIRALESNGLKVKSIMDKTPIPHNGCRPPKRRRV